jgi:hypothetical protein
MTRKSVVIGRSKSEAYEVHQSIHRKVLRMAQKSPVDRSINGSLPRSQVQPKVFLQFPSDLALRDRVEVRVTQNRLHSTVDFRVRWSRSTNVAPGVRPCSGYRNIKIICWGAREWLIQLAPIQAIGSVPSRLISGWGGISTVTHLRWRRREAARFIVCLATIN